MHIETKCLQAGYEPKNGEPRVLPIYQSTTYKYDSSVELGELFDLKADGHMYSRISNPTVAAVEAKIADLEGGVGAMLTSSGQAASFMAIFNICCQGQNFISLNNIYGGTINLFSVTLARMGIEVRYARDDIRSTRLLRGTITKRVGFSWFDSSRKSSTIGNFFARIWLAICSKTFAPET